ncbi:MAG: hypothetical protein ROY99_12435 [Ignavibacterium sp.]|jgi:hypothetical protein|nr:hypothetical protein [Ignavibacterium sp.]
MKKVGLYISVLYLFSLLISCSTGLSQKEFEDLNIKISNIQSWLNLMPGGPGSFHITGKYELPENLNEKEIFLDKIIIMEKDKEIYSLTAELQLFYNSEMGIKEFTFSNYYQTKIDPVLIKKDTIEVKLIFSVNGLLIRKDFGVIPLLRVY